MLPNLMHGSNVVEETLLHLAGDCFCIPFSSLLIMDFLWLSALWPFHFSLACLVKCLAREIKVAKKSKQSIKP